MHISPDPTLAEYAAFLVACLRDSLNIELPPWFESYFISNARRLSVSFYEDLGSLVLIECQEEKGRGGAVSPQDLRRIVDRVRHRLSRGARRQLSMDAADTLPAEPGLSQERTAAAVRGFVSQLDPTDMLVFEHRIFLGKPVAAVATELGLSPANVYRRVAAIRTAFETYVRECI